MSRKTKDEIDQDLATLLSEANSWEERIEILLIQLIREVKKGRP